LGRSFNLEKKHGHDGGLADAAPHYHGHRERLRGRFREAGPEALSDYELLELLLFRALPRRDVKPLAKTLLAKFGSFAEVIAAHGPANFALVHMPLCKGLRNHPKVFLAEYQSTG
jgi:hypothetical protein